MLLEYSVFVLLVHLGAALTIDVGYGPFDLKETQGPEVDNNKFGSTWTGQMELPHEFKRSVKESEILAGKIARAVVAAVMEGIGETASDDALIRNFGLFNGEPGQLLFSVYMHATSKWAFIASVPRGNGAKEIAWAKIDRKAPLLHRAIHDLEKPPPRNTAEVHAEEVAFSLFEESPDKVITKKVDPSFFDQTQTKGTKKRPPGNGGYPRGSVVGSWVIYGDGNPTGFHKPACSPDKADSIIRVQKDRRAACLIISNELGVRTTDKGEDPIAGSESERLQCQEPALKKQKTLDEPGEGSSKNIQRRAKACPIPSRSKSAPSTSARMPTARFSRPSTGKPTSIRGAHATGKKTTMKTVVIKSKTTTAAAAFKTRRPDHSNFSALEIKPKTTRISKTARPAPTKTKQTTSKPTKGKGKVKTKL